MTLATKDGADRQINSWLQDCDQVKAFLMLLGLYSKYYTTLVQG